MNVVCLTVVYGLRIEVGLGKMRSLESTLALWAAGLLSSDQVIEWATSELEKVENPSAELMDLITDGPERCLKRPSYEFRARPLELSYVQEFSLRATTVSLDSDDSVLKFADWAARHCICEDLTLPMVLLGYQVDHLLNDCRDQKAAMALVRDELPSLLAQCRKIASSFEE